MQEIIVDNFAGSGGASTGIELATGRSVDVAINHDSAAIAMPRAKSVSTQTKMNVKYSLNGRVCISTRE